jgi:hypothetical protein
VTSLHPVNNTVQGDTTITITMAGFTICHMISCSNVHFGAVFGTSAQNVDATGNVCTHTDSTHRPNEYHSRGRRDSEGFYKKDRKIQGPSTQ